MSKKLEQKQQRRLAEERRKAETKREQRKKNLVTILIAGVIVALVAFLVISDRKAAEGPIGVAAEEAGCGEVEEVEAIGNDHIEEGQSPQYNSTPPTSGPHYASPADTGFYETPLEPQRVLHNLEHGQIVFWYAPDAPDELKSDLEAVADRQPAATVVHPYEGATEYNFYMTAWNKLPNEPEESFGTGYLQGCDAVSQEVVDDFRREHQGKSPEPITPPFRG